MSEQAVEQGAVAPNVLILGCGYCGLALGERLSSLGRRVWGTVRDASVKGASLTQAGVTPIEWSMGVTASPARPEGVSGAWDVVWSIPTLSGEREHLAPVEALVEALSGWSVRSLVYWSATSVYADSGGEVVSAGSALGPVTGRGRRRLETERLLWARGEALGWRVCSARMPGIYGPGRSVVSRMRSGRYTLVDGGVKWSARIHRDDVAMATEVILRHGEAGAAYLVTDDHPFQVRDMVAWIRQQDPSVPAPPVKSLAEFAAEKPFAASFWRSSNRYDNSAVAALPGFKLRYPSYKDGLVGELSAALPG